MYLYLILHKINDVHEQIIAITDDIDGSPNVYTIIYSELMSGKLCGLFTVQASSCVDERCVHKFNISSSSCSISYDISVSMFSTNIFGEGPSSEPVVFSLLSYRLEQHSKYLTIMYYNYYRYYKSSNDTLRR